MRSATLRAPRVAIRLGARSIASAADSSANSSAAASEIDSLLRPPRELPQAEQLRRMRRDDAERGQRSFSLPEPLAADGARPSYRGWGDYFTARGWDAGCHSDRLLLQTLTGALSCPLTAWAALEKHGVRLSADETLELHVIGAANSMEGALLRSGWAWDELAELLLPVGARARLCLVGHEIDSASEVQLGERMTAVCHKGDYIKWRLESDAATPSLALGLNSGLGTDQNLWREVLQLLLEEEAPLVFTSFDDADAESDARELDALEASRISEPNPFFSALPELRTAKQGEAESKAPTRIGYANSTWHVVRGRRP